MVILLSQSHEMNTYGASVSFFPLLPKINKNQCCLYTVIKQKIYLTAYFFKYIYMYI